mgnify:CR=1 FL=1
MKQIVRLAVRPAFERMADTLDDRLGSEISAHGVDRNRGDSCHE